MPSINNTSCCGLDEIANIYDELPIESLLRACEEDMDTPFYFFTGTPSEKGVEALKEYIIKNKLGSVLETKRRVNPNSGNRLKVYVWEVNRRSLAKWYKTNKVKLDDYEDNDDDADYIW